MKAWLLVLATLCNGCVVGFLNDAFAGRHRFQAEQARIHAAIKARNHVELEDFIHHSEFEKSTTLARKEFLRIRREQLAAASCIEVDRELSSHTGASNFLEFHERADNDTEKQQIRDEVIAKIADCKSPLLFTTRVLGDDIVGKLLVDLERQGKPVFEAFLALVRSPDADYVESATFTWLNKTKTAASCPELERNGDVNDGTRDFLLGFYSTKGCRAEAVRTARVLVSSRSSAARMHACNAMRVLGDSSLLPQMRVLADNDTSTHVEAQAYEGWAYTVVVASGVTYPVREACQEAINELRTKAMSRR
jgi:hypothetical protein